MKHERSTVKNLFSTYIWSKVDSCFCEAVYVRKKITLQKSLENFACNMTVFPRGWNREVSTNRGKTHQSRELILYLSTFFSLEAVHTNPLLIFEEMSGRKTFLDHRSFLGLFLFRHGLKSELEEISQKFNFLLKGTVSKHLEHSMSVLQKIWWKS